MAKVITDYPGDFYMTKEAACHRTRVIIAEELDLIFTMKELKQLSKLIRKRKDPETIAEMMGRDIREVFHATVHLMFDKRFNISGTEMVVRIH